MSRRVLFGFIFLNVLVTGAVLLLAWTFWLGPRNEQRTPVMGPTQIVILTATPAPGFDIKPADYQATIAALEAALDVRAAAPPAAGVTPTGAGDVTESADSAGETAIPTLNPALLPPVPSALPPGADPLVADESVEDDGCIRHVVEAGEVVSIIAQDYGVLPGDVLAANGMEPDDILHIGDVLIIPIEGCAALRTPTPVPSPTNTPFSLTQVAATVTLPPAAENAQIEIVSVANFGDVNTEMIELRNVGERINLEGWSLVDEQGNTFTFPGFYMPRDSRVRIYTRQGTNTPAALYWGRDEAVWSPGEVVTLNDPLGLVQAIVRIGGEGEASLPPG